MPPCHGDSPLRHRAFRVALGYGSKNASRLFIEKRVEQCHATSEIRLDVRRRTLSGRSPFRRRANRPVRERSLSRHGLRRENYWPTRQEEPGEASAVEPCSRLADFILPANSKLTQATRKIVVLCDGPNALIRLSLSKGEGRVRVRFGLCSVSEPLTSILSPNARGEAGKYEEYRRFKPHRPTATQTQKRFYRCVCLARRVRLPL